MNVEKKLTPQEFESVSCTNISTPPLDILIVCNLCKNLDVRGKIVRAIFKKLNLQPEAKEFVMSAPANSAEQNMLISLITKISSYVKETTGVSLVLASSDAGVDAVDQHTTTGGACTTGSTTQKLSRAPYRFPIWPLG